MSKQNKTYGKRGSSAPVASFNFDKLIAESSKRPIAAKSAGVIGKWGTTSFTSLRSSQVNGEKAVKCGISPVKCHQPDYSSVKIPSSGGTSDPFGFDSTFEGSTPVNAVTASAVPTQPKPRKFFKSRGTEDTVKSTPNAGSTYAQSPLEGVITNPPTSARNSENPYAHSYSSVSNTAYASPATYSSQSKTGKRGRGRPRGSKNASPRSAGAAKAASTSAVPRGGSRGRGRRGKAGRGARGAGRGKRKRQEWEESESEDQGASSEEAEEEEMGGNYAAQQFQEQQLQPTWDDEGATMDEEVEDDEEEDEEDAEEDQDEKNGTHKEVEEAFKPPIKLRIIRRNDTDAFVTKVQAEDSTSNDLPDADQMDEPSAPVAPVAPVAPAPVISPAPEEEEGLSSSQTSVAGEEHPPEPSPPHRPSAVVDRHDEGDSSDSRVPNDSSLSVPPVIAEEEPFQPPTESTISEENIPSIQLASTIAVQYHKKSSIFKSRSNASSGNGSGPIPTSSGSNTNIATKKELLTTASKGKKGLALYRHKWHEDKEGADGSRVGLTGGSGAAAAGSSHPDGGQTPSFNWDEMGDEGQDPQPPPKMARIGTSAKQQGPYSVEDDDPESGDGVGGSIRCPRRTKDYYTVVRNVKKAHQIQESGEFQEFNDDVDYILDALKAHNPTATRCLSAMSLASKCMEPAFRMHLRAHSTVAKFFQALKDAPTKASVALCTSCIMFVLTQDRLNMDLDRDSLELMLNLLETDAVQVDPSEGKELEKNRSKVRELCEEMVRKGHAPHLQLDSITSAQLAMETLLSLTSKKAGEWFKEELRVLGGLDHIIQTVTQCTSTLTCSTHQSGFDDQLGRWNWDKSRLDALKKVDRCLRVLENVTFQNEENQCYLLEYSNGRLVDATLNLLQLLSREVGFYSPPIAKDSLGHLLSESLSNMMKVVMNLTHDNNDDCLGSRVYGERPLTWQTTLICLLQTPDSLPEEKRFDVMTLALGILINLVERCDVNRDRLLSAPIPSNPEDIFDGPQTAVSALINLFITKEESARLEEARTDEILDGKAGPSEGGSSNSANAGTSDASTGGNKEDVMEETVKKLLHKAGRHMEDSMVAAYVGLLIGYIVMKNRDYEHQVKELLPGKKFTLMIAVLKKFYEFLKLTANAVTSTRGLKNTQLVIKFMESSDGLPTATSSYRMKSESAIDYGVL